MINGKQIVPPDPIFNQRLQKEILQIQIALERMSAVWTGPEGLDINLRQMLPAIRTNQKPRTVRGGSR